MSDDVELKEAEPFPRWRRAGASEPAGLRVWVEDALCAIWHGDWCTDIGGVIEKAICRACPVQVACLTYALDAGEAHGIWGGLSADERRTLIGRSRAAEAQPAAAGISSQAA